MTFNPKAIPLQEFKLLPENLEGLHVLEFGNKGNKNGLYRNDYVSAGVASYHCVDINGQDGAIPVDLRSESAADQIREATGMDSFDLITNFGMSEHIPVQRTFYKCIHELADVGTRIVHWTPAARKFREHGNQGSIWHAEENFFDALSFHNEYTIEIKPEIYDKRILNTRLRIDEKTDFVWNEDFDSLFWYNELWLKSPWGEHYRRTKDKRVFETIE
jgi:hypothetical protein